METMTARSPADGLALYAALRSAASGPPERCEDPRFPGMEPEPDDEAAPSIDEWFRTLALLRIAQTGGETPGAPDTPSPPLMTPEVVREVIKAAAALLGLVLTRERLEGVAAAVYRLVSGNLLGLSPEAPAASREPWTP